MDHLVLSLLISSFVIPLLLAITILVVSKRDLPKKVMAFALLNAFFVFLANYFYFQKLYVFYIHVHSLHIATVLWLFPSIYLYVKSIVSNNLKKELVHLLPGLLFGITSALIFYGFLDQEERVLYLSTYRTGVEFTQLNLKVLSVFRLVDVLMIVFQVVYYSIAFIRIPGNH